VLPNNFDDVTLADIERLVHNGVAEGTRLDFKAALPGRTAADSREFASDVASFANTDGGDIIFGVQETAGIATAVPGVPCADVDAAVLRFDSIVQDSVDPRITGLRIRGIREGGRCVVVVRVPRTWWGLHMVVSDGLQRFVARNSAGKYLLDVREIRAKFVRGAEGVERARDFHRHRVLALRSGEPPASAPWNAGLVLHCIPLATDLSLGVDLHAAKQLGLLLALYPTASNLSFNLDGVLARGDHGHATLYRSGTMESASSSLVRELIPSRVVAESLIGAVDRYLRLCANLGLTAPVAVLSTLFGARGAKLAVSTEWQSGYYENAFDRDVLALPEVIAETIDSDVPALLRPVLDGLWQAAGLERCGDYDESGAWRKR
jgi:hypothetical protein